VSGKDVAVELALRDAVVGDVDRLRAVYREASLSNEGDRTNLLAHPETLVWPDLAVREGRTRVVVRDGGVMGFATTLEVDGVMELEDLFVDPAWMRQGVATQLVRDAVAVAAHRGAGRVEVTGNEHARAFYERVGFVHDGVAQTQFGPGLRMHIDTGA
jgi:GNAT superfamily N-acetyltransferase